MRISAVIPAYNCERFLDRAIRSLLDTGYPDLEIVVVDDGSRDATAEIAERWSHENPQRIRTDRHPGGVNRGVSATRNLGFQHCTGDAICLLDADDYIHPWRFETAAAILQSDSHVDAVHENAELIFADEESEQRWWSEKQRFGFTTAVDPEELLYRLLGGICWPTSAILFRRALLDRSGVFDERLRIAEDCHLWFRMACVGHIVSGDLTRPVSVYWRRADSAYQPSLQQRRRFLLAAHQFLKWMRRQNAADPRIPRVMAAIRENLLSGIEQARRDGEQRIAWQLAWDGSWFLPELFGERRYLGHLARMALGR